MKKQSLIVSGIIAAAAAALAPAIATAEVNQPQEIIMRPRTTPGGQITILGDFLIQIAPDPIGTTMGLRAGGSYGINDKLEAGLTYKFALKDFEAKGDLVIGAAYSLVEGNLGVAANLDFGYNLVGSVDATTGETTGALDPLGIGARVQFRLNDKLAIRSGGSQLQIGLEEPNDIVLKLPIGVGFQATQQIFAFLDTGIGNIVLKGDGDSAFIFADIIPLRGGAFFSPSNAMDFGASIEWEDIKDGSDVLGIVLMGRLHM